MSRWQRWTLGGVGCAALAHAAPSVTSFAGLRRRCWPHLSGVGLPSHVALTFDDGPDPSSTPAVLDALERLGWKATFFMLGTMVRRAPSLAGEVVAAGHEVAVHGDTHRRHLWRTGWGVAADLDAGTEAVVAATGRVPLWFRPPYGTLTTGAVVAAHRRGLRPVLWTAWGRDWRAAATAHTVVADVERGVAAGGTVLLHDSDCTSDPGSWRATLGALPLLAERWSDAGLSVGPLADHGL